jgi:predicted RNase H-like HicB family nuclease
VRNYTVVVHEESGSGFWAEVPALRGCYSQGETLEELKRNIGEAIAGMLDVLKQEGSPGL